MDFQFDKKWNRGYGYWTCKECDTYTDRSDRPPHKLDCTLAAEGWDSSTYNFGPGDLEFIKRFGHSMIGPNELTLSYLRQKMPELVQI